MIAENNTRKPQKMQACITPGSAFWKSLRCPNTWTSSRRARAPASAVGGAGRGDTRRALRARRAAPGAGRRPLARAPPPHEADDRDHEDRGERDVAQELARRRTSS